MTPDDIRCINTLRLKSWRERLIEHGATPLILVGIGHGETAGDLVLCVPEETMTNAQIAAFLAAAIDMLET